MSLRPKIQPHVEENLFEEVASLWSTYRIMLRRRGAAELNAVYQHLDRLLADNFGQLDTMAEAEKAFGVVKWPPGEGQRDIWDQIQKIAFRRRLVMAMLDYFCLGVSVPDWKELGGTLQDELTGGNRGHEFAATGLRLIDGGAVLGSQTELFKAIADEHATDEGNVHRQLGYVGLLLPDTTRGRPRREESRERLDRLIDRWRLLIAYKSTIQQ